MSNCFSISGVLCLDGVCGENVREGGDELLEDESDESLDVEVDGELLREFDFDEDFSRLSSRNVEGPSQPESESSHTDVLSSEPESVLSTRCPC